MVINDNKTEIFIYSTAYKESSQRNAPIRAVRIETEIPRAWILADAKISEKGYHYSS